MYLTIDEARACVARGMDWLNMWEPYWRESVNLDTLEVRHNDRCVIAQVYGDFQTAAEDNPELADPIYGFITHHPDFPPETPPQSWLEWDEAQDQVRQAYALLQQAWEEALSKPCEHSYVAGGVPLKIRCVMCGHTPSTMFGRTIN